MKTLLAICISVAGLFVLFPTSAQAEGRNVYITPKVMWTHQQHDGIVHLQGGQGKFNDNLLGGAIAIGYDFYGDYSYPVRLELEVAMRGKGKHNEQLIRTNPTGGGMTGTDPLTVKMNNGYEIDATTLFANIYFDYHNETSFTPYIGGGLGMVRLKGEGTVLRGFKLNPDITTAISVNDKVSETTWNVAWNISAGVA